MKNLLKRLLKSIHTEKIVSYTVPVLQSELLSNRTIVITGGTGGIGFAMAKAFTAAGANVVITGRDKGRLDAAVNKLNRKTSAFFLDNNVPESFPSAVAQLFEENPTIDALVNNAGVVSEEDTIAAYDKVMTTNLRGSYFLSQEFAGQWKKRKVDKANILTVCSTSSLRPGVSPYVLSKWGLRAMTIGLAKNLIKQGVVVNGIAPGPTSVDGGDITLPKNPSGRRVTPEEIANLSVILVSDLSRMVVGDILYVGGGAGVITVDDI